jgi:hypothetical protein
VPPEVAPPSVPLASEGDRHGPTDLVERSVVHDDLGVGQVGLAVTFGTATANGLSEPFAGCLHSWCMVLNLEPPE